MRIQLVHLYVIISHENASQYQGALDPHSILEIHSRVVLLFYLVGKRFAFFLMRTSSPKNLGADYLTIS